jgi:hypothetical protein
MDSAYRILGTVDANSVLLPSDDKVGPPEAGNPLRIFDATHTLCYLCSGQFGV